MKRPNNHLQEFFVLAYEHAQLTADLTVQLCTAQRPMVIDTVEYCNPTGLAEHAANFFTVKALADGNVAASWSTETGEEGTIAADTLLELTNGTLANRSLATGDVLSVFFDEDGTATLPAGRVVIHGRYLG